MRDFMKNFVASNILLLLFSLIFILLMLPAFCDADISEVSAGGYHNLVLKSDGTVWTWGDNFYGQLGDGTTTDSSSPVQENTLSTEWSAIAAGIFHTVALKSGTVWTWGRNSEGQLGDGTTSDSSSPVQENTHSTDWLAIAAGEYHTIALKSDGTLWAWGENHYGQLGDGTDMDSSSPVQESTLSTSWVAIAAGKYHTVALKLDGTDRTDRTVWTWGRNSDGQLGDGTTTTSFSPVQESTLSTNWMAIAAGAKHTVAIRSNGTLWAWGDNMGGQLGNGTTTDSPSPLQENSLSTNWGAIAAGDLHTVALKSDGELWGWGMNGYGQLGDGTTTPIRTSPVQEITHSSDWMAVSAGSYHTLALKLDGSVLAWGRNTDGLLGDGTTTDSSTPIQSGERIDYFCDSDEDTYVGQDVDGTCVAEIGTSSGCEPEACDVTAGSDCDDNNSVINPDTFWYQDNDGDTFGNYSLSLRQCTQPTGPPDYVLDNTDCDNYNPNIYPGGPPVMVDGETSSYYSVLQNAYNNAQDGDTIMVKAVTFTEDLDLDDTKNVTLMGGYDCSYSISDGITTINGTLTVNDGLTTIEKFMLE